MLAYPLEEKRLLKWTPPYIVQPKYDGERCRAVITPEGCILYSSECNEILTVPHIQQSLEDLSSDLGRIELDGELYTHGLPLNEIHSIISTKSLHPNFEEMQFHIFDIIDEQQDQSTRLVKLSQLKPTLEDYDCLRVAPFTLCDTFDQVMSALEWSMSQSYEGIIVRHLTAPYIRRRSTFMMKFKPRREDSYLIVGVTEEESIYGKKKDSLGALICRAHDSEETFHVGTGFNADERRELWKIRECLPGLRVTIKYQHLTSIRGVPRSAVYSHIEWED